jgi:phage-related protein
VTTHAEEIKAALIGIGVALGAAGLVAAIAGVVAAINPVTLIIAAIVAAVGLLSAAWTGNWGGIRDTVTQIWEGFLKPILTVLWDWLSTNIPAALETLSGFWTGTLLPAIQAVWAFMTDSVFPLFQAIAKFLDAVFSVAVRALAGIWENIFLPPLQTIYGFLQDNIFPIFRELSEFVERTFQPVFEELGEFFDNSLVPAFTAIGDAISGVIDWLNTMADTLQNMALPEWMTPGSPTPWEIGLLGINRAMGELNQQLPVLAHGLQMQPNGMPLGLASSVDQSVSNSVQVIGNVIIRGDTTPGSLGTALKGRRY